MPDGAVQFCVEDTIGLKDDSTQVGVVDRAFGDVDSHEPRPQRDYEDDIIRHDDIPEDDFMKFLRSGIPPRGTVLVSWQTAVKTELIPESRLELLDRALYVGDVVKKNAKDHMSGTVIGKNVTCNLFPTAFFNGGQVSHSVIEERSIRRVPVEEIINCHEYVEGALALYGDWVGRIEQVYDEVAVKLSNNSVVVIENADELEPDDTTMDRLSVGDMITTKKGTLRRGRWRYGVYDANIRPRGMVVETRTVWISVQWLAKKFGAGGANVGGRSIEPPSELSLDELESGRFRVYDASGNSSSTLPLMANGVDHSYHVADIAVADRVRFKDLAGAAVKYDGTTLLTDGKPQGKVTKIPRTETLGSDMNVYLCLQSHTRVTVQWQDLSVTEDYSSSFIPDPNVEDDDEVWPGEIVCTKEQREKAADVTWTFEPNKVGVVQSVNSRDRIASVRWFKNPNIRFLGDDLIPPSETGSLHTATEDVSLYDIRSTPSLTRRRGDFVLIHPDSIPTSVHDSSEPTWFGEVVDLGLDGQLTIRLGAARPVIDIQLPAERVTLVYSSDMPDSSLGNLMQTLDGDSIEDSEEEDLSDFDNASFNDMWIEYEGAQPVGNVDDDDWSTEDEESDDDESMPDLAPADNVETSKTTPEIQSDAEHHSTDPLLQPQPGVHRSSSKSEDLTLGSADFNADVDPDAPSPFLVLDSEPPLDHRYLDVPVVNTPGFTKRIAKEHKILRSALPPGIFVRTWESRLDVLRVLMIGPSDTPYEFAPFIIDFHLSASYPAQPPAAFFHSWTNGNGPVNPNLYEDGKICLSLLGTWHADERNESWSPAKSTLLQVLVSLMGLVLVKEPYYNEAGYDVHRAAPETKLSSALYTERAYFRARAFITHALENNISPFSEEIKYLYLSNKENAPRLLDSAIQASKDILTRSQNSANEEERDGLRKISLGATVMLKRQLDKLERLRTANSK
ncbi:hypothetical protein BU24DRAFT_427241 [Aaosphaeria arxii CBS 175.79]|uniref:UBC core domain-containing protein n=1 Tax=Aaosphaeria arxii CBS 175.79 TaxID=1450172 RepID=A0A6A5XDX5_9PLEO|nr:uncharacterized protein BU24DRAFT_427241 [Aaosphaeria arxii CBS 175.79]KAF2011036.1 hypothetical protein BU24DRAFT_427241 [Aaosphaeria arxii CBS 175.79]